jgi:hypothetical protein
VESSIILACIKQTASGCWRCLLRWVGLVVCILQGTESLVRCPLHDAQLLRPWGVRGAAFLADPKDSIRLLQVAAEVRGAGDLQQSLVHCPLRNVIVCATMWRSFLASCRRCVGMLQVVDVAACATIMTQVPCR